MPGSSGAVERAAGRAGRLAFSRPQGRELAALLPVAIWAWLLLARGRYWSTNTGLPLASAPPARWPAVAVIVPARDEADLLPQTLPSLLTQEYPGHARVVLVDDMSTDRTAEVARALAAGTVLSEPGTVSLQVVSGGARPPGWAGKPWAMAQGTDYALGQSPPPEWLLFTDADVLHPQSSLRQLVAAAVSDRRDVVSLMARLHTSTAWEKLLLPAFVYFFAQIYPFSWVNRRQCRTAAAAGGCVLVRSAALRAAGGPQVVSGSTIDDVALARALKRSGHGIWLGLAGGPGAPQVRSLRSYPRLADIWEMVTRSAYTQLRNNPAALAGTVAALSTTYLAPPLLGIWGAARRRPVLALSGFAAWGAMAASYLPTVRYYRASPAAALVLPLIAGLYEAMTIDSARRHYQGALTWKGRPIAGQSPLGARGSWPRPEDGHRPTPRTEPGYSGRAGY
jgi:hopene-associated glycosyltransferase HpnB